VAGGWCLPATRFSGLHAGAFPLVHRSHPVLRVPCKRLILTHALGPAGRRDQDTAPVSILEKNRLRCPTYSRDLRRVPWQLLRKLTVLRPSSGGLQRRRAEHERAVSNRRGRALEFEWSVSGTNEPTARCLGYWGHCEPTRLGDGLACRGTVGLTCERFAIFHCGRWRCLCVPSPRWQAPRAREQFRLAHCSRPRNGHLPATVHNAKTCSWSSSPTSRVRHHCQVQVRRV